jgi:hypothetical protein
MWGIMFKEQDTMFVTEPKTDEHFILACKIKGIWMCRLCPITEDYKVRMLNHVRFHIEVK